MRVENRMFAWKSLALLFLLAPAALTCGCANTGYPIHLPALTIEPQKTAPAFAARIREMAAGDPEKSIVCIIRFDASLSDERQLALGRRATILKGSRRDTWFVRVSASTLASFLTDEHALWIGEYKDEYKLGRRADAIGAERRWVHVVSFAGNRPEFREDLHDIGAGDIRYDSILDEYRVYINGGQRDRLIAMWWVREIYKAGGRGLDRMMRSRRFPG